MSDIATSQDLKEACCSSWKLFSVKDPFGVDFKLCNLADLFQCTNSNI